MPDIFISYASADRERARALAGALANRGYSVWWDRTIPPGRVFDEVIQEAIQGARCMIVLWSADSVRSNWVKTEAAEGSARGILVPAMLAEVAPPIEFKRIQSANLANWDGDESHGEYRNLLDSVDRLMKQAPRAVSSLDSGVSAYGFPASSAGSKLRAFKTFALGALFALVLAGGWWAYTRLTLDTPSAGETVPSALSSNTTDSLAPAAGNSPAGNEPGTGKTARGRVNLLLAENGGQVLVASTEKWKLLIDGKEDTYTWTETGFGVFGFRDGKTALIDTFTVLIPAQEDSNLKEFELFAGNTSPTGPFESLGRFNTQNMRMMQNPYQEFHFTPVKAKYFKLQSLRSHRDSGSMFAYEIQLFGELR